MGPEAPKSCVTLSGVLPSARLRLGLIGAALMAVLVAAAGAQGLAGADADAFARITKEAANSTPVDETAAFLTDVYGPRLTGSPHLRGAGAYVIERLKGWGVPARFERWGPFGPGWTTDRFVAMAISPTPFPLVAFPKAWTPGTPGPVVANATLAVISTEEDFKKFKGKLKGLFVLVANPDADAPSPATGPVGPRLTDTELRALSQPLPPAEAPETRAKPTTTDLEFARKRMGFFVEEGVAALLEPGGSGGFVVVGDGRLRDESAFGGQGFYPWPDEVATQVVVATEQYNRLARLLQRGILVTIEMEIASNYHTLEADSFNIVADLPGTDLADEVVMLGAHFDSLHGGTGATDDAAGCAVILDAMRILRASNIKTRRTIRAVLWTGSEQGNLGARWYVTHNLADPAVMDLRPEHQRLSAYFNLDRGAGAIRGLYLQGNLAAAPMLERWIAPLRNKGVATLSPRPTTEGDHLAFDAVGLPAFDFIQDPGRDPRVRHSVLDTLDKVDADDLANNAAIVAWIAYRAANEPDKVPRKPLPPPDKNAAGPWSPGR